MTVDIVATLAGAGISAALLRFYSEKETISEKNAVVSTAFISATALFFISFGAVFLFAAPVAGLILDTAARSNFVRIIAASMALTATIEIPLVLLRAQSRPVAFVVISASKLAMQLTLNIVFVVVLRMGVIGVLYSGLISSVLLSAYLTAMTFRRSGVTFSFPIFRELFSYGYPLIFSNLGAFVLASSDRYFLKAFGTLYEVGIYSLGYKFGALVTTLVLTPFLLFWNVEIFEIDKRADKHEVFPTVLSMLALLAVTLMFGLTVFVPEVLRVMSDPKFWDAGKVVALICLAYYIYMIENHVRSALLITKNTQYVAYATTAAAISCLLLNGLLIPKFGVYGAAIATVLAYGVRLSLVFYWSQRVYPIHYEWWRVLLLPVYAAVFLLLSYQFGDVRLWQGIVKDTLVFVLFCGFVYWRWMRAEERTLIIKIIREPARALKILVG
ncbi:MAG: polysaccharide biosynthesis protein [Candidatus Zixiibacteriota bacterium]|nr:MAG: polysaccharide biosynthesis protein [candidate division Zixibacteria bacterium]